MLHPRSHTEFQEKTQIPTGRLFHFLLNKNSEWANTIVQKDKTFRHSRRVYILAGLLLGPLNNIKLCSGFNTLNGRYNTLSYGLFAVTMRLCVALQNRVLPRQCSHLLPTNSLWYPAKKTTIPRHRRLVRAKLTNKEHVRMTNIFA